MKQSNFRKQQWNVYILWLGEGGVALIGNTTATNEFYIRKHLLLSEVTNLQTQKKKYFGVVFFFKTFFFFFFFWLLLTGEKRRNRKRRRKKKM